MTEVREHVRRLWTEALGIDVAGDTDFFSEGGQSFMATRIIARLDRAFQTRIPLRVLFDNPRFDDFASAVERLIEQERVA